jgi:hypothetical protein
MKTLKSLLVCCSLVVASTAYAGAAFQGKSGRGAENGYVWANQPATASYTPSLTYQYNSTGANNTITRTAVGTYHVTFPGLTAAGGHVQVTAYGSGPERCKVGSWGGSPVVVNVYCHNNAGVLVDTYYNVQFVN